MCALLKPIWQLYSQYYLIIHYIELENQLSSETFNHVNFQLHIFFQYLLLNGIFQKIGKPNNVIIYNC